MNNISAHAVASIQARQDEYIADACCWVAEPSLRLVIALVGLHCEAELLQDEARMLLFAG